VSLVVAGCSLTGEPRFRRPIEVASADGAAAMDAAMGDGGAEPDVVIAPDGAFEDGPVVQPDVVIAPDGGVVDAGPPCPAGEVQCDGVCVVTASNPQHCGSCNLACAVSANTVPSCVRGMCVSSCVRGFSDCDGRPGNGCETAIDTIDNCGDCGINCNRPNAVATCVGGTTCGQTCATGFGDCDRNASTGCETSLATNMNCGACGHACTGATPVCNAATGVCGPPGCPMGFSFCMDVSTCVNLPVDPRHCGRCGNVCPQRPNSVPACRAGGCTITCNPGFANCDANDENGCEVDLSRDITNCGGCGNRCAFGPNSRAVCSAGVCGVACDPGRLNCDGNAANGCEAFSVSDANCGRCGNRCGAGMVCSVSRAGSAPSCAVGLLCSIGGQVRCGAGCVDLLRDSRHCGDCFRQCAGTGGQQAACNGGRCGLCASGSARCDLPGPNFGRCCSGVACLTGCVAPTVP
jgi:hypothetical protein